MAEHPWLREDPLARVPPETTKANLALREYVAIGPTRSLDKLVVRLRDGSGTTRWRSTLSTWSGKYAWQARCEAFDLAYRQQLVEQELTERLRSREERIRSYHALRGVAASALVRRRQALEEGARLGDVARAIDVANKGEAEEYGDDPLTRAFSLLVESGLVEWKLNAIRGIIAAPDEAGNA